MAEWRTAAKREGWATFSGSVRVVLGARKHKVRVLELDTDVEFSSEVPHVDDPRLVLDLLATNRTNGLAFWRLDAGQPRAVSRCPKGANAETLALYMRETAALADALELRLTECDR